MKPVIALLAGSAVLLWSRPRRRRLPEHKSSEATTPAVSRARGRWWAAAIGGVAIAITVGGWPGFLIGIVCALAIGFLIAGLESRADRQRRARLVADLPLTIELLAACLRAGHSVGSSLQAISDALESPLGNEVALVAAAFRLGAEPREAWGRFLEEPALAAVGRAMIRSSDSGAPLAELLERLATDVRRTRRFDAERRARAVGVKAAAPLGLCFLPAFILIGIVPIVAGAIADLLH